MERMEICNTNHQRTFVKILVQGIGEQAKCQGRGWIWGTFFCFAWGMEEIAKSISFLLVVGER